MVSFFFNDTATTEIYTLSLHDALPILTLWRTARIATENGEFEVVRPAFAEAADGVATEILRVYRAASTADRKSTRLNSSHANISYAVFCLKKKLLHHRCLLQRLPIARM